MQFHDCQVRTWEDEWNFLERTLKDSGFDSFGGGMAPSYSFRSRFAHTQRVMKWAKQILSDVDTVDKVVLELAIIFHDIGYSSGENKPHALHSVEIFRKYAKEHDLVPDRVDEIAWLIENHSNKDLLNKPGVSNELIIMMQADMLDEEGAMRLAWDCMAEAMSGGKSFESALLHTLKYWNPEYNPMVTQLAQKFWQRKQQFVMDYVTQMEFDLETASSLDNKYK